MRSSQQGEYITLLHRHQVTSAAITQLDERQACPFRHQHCWPCSPFSPWSSWPEPSPPSRSAPWLDPVCWSLCHTPNCRGVAAQNSPCAWRTWVHPSSSLVAATPCTALHAPVLLQDYTMGLTVEQSCTTPTPYQRPHKFSVVYSRYNMKPLTF